MENNLEDILFLMDKYTSSNFSELDEQGDPAPSSGGGGGSGGYPSVTKWETGLKAIEAFGGSVLSCYNLRASAETFLKFNEGVGSSKTSFFFSLIK